MPPLALNSLETPSQRSAHSGYAHLARGVVGAFRNPTAHDAKIKFTLSEEDTLDMLATSRWSAAVSIRPPSRPAAPRVRRVTPGGS